MAQELVTNGMSGLAARNAINDNFGELYNGFVDIKWYGAVGDGVADDTTAIQNAAAECLSSGKRLFASPGTYRVTATIVINCNCDLGLATFTANATTVTPVVRCGLTSGTSIDAIFTQDRILPKVVNSAKPSTGWAGITSSVGIDIGNCSTCRFTVPFVTGFGIGVDVGGYNSGCAYNDIFLGRLFDNLINLRVGPKEITGWSNENNYYNGRFGFDSDEGTNISGARQIQLRNPVGAENSPPNNNVFHKPSVEGNGAEFHLDIQGSFNTFINPRTEASPIKIRFFSVGANQTNSNVFINGYRLTQPEYTFDGDASSYNKWIGSRINDSYEYTGCGMSFVNRSSSTISGPQLQGFPATESAITKTADSTDWTWRLFGNGFATKQTGDDTANHRFSVSTSGHLRFGFGSAPPDVLLRAGSGTPEGVVTASPGSLFLRTNGGAGEALYVKESGTGNTGWVAK